MTQRYLRSEVIPISEIIPYVKTHWKEKRVRIQRSSGIWVGVSSRRMRTFARAGLSAKGMKCVCCDLEATFFAVEQSPGQDSWHLNLYGVRDGEEILFTHDHIKARALGGADDLTNTQIMCSPCNGKKSKGETKEVLRLRKLKAEDAEINDTV
jgi:hypothetical protein